LTLDKDHDQVENAELANKEAAEPMPRNVQDFKDHPYYALERHLRRNEVVHPKREVGKISAGKSSAVLEPIYRRRDVKLVRSADRWYRLGREIRVGELPLKHAAKPHRRCGGRSTRSGAHSDADDNDDEDETGAAAQAATALYAESQTDLYVPPPVLRGRVPRNAFGNLDVYVPSMIPAGGVHVRAPEAARAARRVAGSGVDAADAVVGFEFRGRRGTAVVQGVVVAREHRDAVEAAVREIRREEVRRRVEREGKEAVRLWRKFVKGLRIRQRIMAHQVDGAVEEEQEQEDDVELAAEQGDEAPGGFLPEQSIAEPLPTARARASQARHRATTERRDDDDDDDPNAPIRLTRALAEIADIEPSIPSPWDRPTALIATIARTSPPPSPSQRVAAEQAGGFLRDDDGEADAGLNSGGGFARNDADDEGEAGGGFVRDDDAGEADELLFGGDDADDGGGGFVREEERPTAASAMQPTRTAAGSVDDHKKKLGAESARRDGDGDDDSDGDGSSRAAVVAPQVGKVVQSTGDGVRDETAEDNVGDDSSAAESLLSHDPDDDEAEPDWIA